MSQNGLFINYDVCFGCRSCVMACSQDKKLPADERGIELYEFGPHKNINGKWEYTFVPVPTLLCDLCEERVATGKKPACVHHCQAAAMEYGPIEELAKLLVDHPRSTLFSL